MDRSHAPSSPTWHSKPGESSRSRRLIERLWGDDPPRTPLGTLQSYVSRLRRAVEPARAAGAAPQVLVSEAPGYVLHVPLEQIDVHRFGALVADARRDAAAGNPLAALRAVRRGAGAVARTALAGVGADDQARSVVVRLDEERAAAVEDRFEALLALGRHAEAVPALQSAVDEQPLRERLWALLALALYRSSRQADALRALSTARSMLLDELGLDPGPGAARAREPHPRAGPGAGGAHRSRPGRRATGGDRSTDGGPARADRPQPTSGRHWSARSMRRRPADRSWH